MADATTTTTTTTSGLSRGKVLPTTAVAPPAWRIRDAAEQLLKYRRERFPDQVNDKPTIHLSTQFEIGPSLAHLQIGEKARIMSVAFTMAGKTVLDAIKKQDFTSVEEKEMVDSEDLPEILNKWDNLGRMRHRSLERSHENKEYAKKKGAKVEPLIVTSSSAAAGTRGSGKKSSDSAAKTPAFTRNTPASSAAALDYRFNSSRAILCAAGNLVFEALTPPLSGFEIDVLDVPQNPAKQIESSPAKSDSNVNMGAVVVEAQTAGQRTISVVENAVRRSTLRYQYRKDNARYDRGEDEKDFLAVPNPFAWKDESSIEEEDDDLGSATMEDTAIPYRPCEHALSNAWSSLCLPRLLAVLKKGAGHAIYHDVQWSTRHGRIADFLRALAKEDNMGPHLIVTTEPEISRFAQEFHDVQSHLRLIVTNEDKRLQVLAYQGSKKQRRKLRQLFPQATGLPESPFHVLVTSYASFLEDYLHFCQLPFEAVILDDGMSWMAAAQGDQNSAIGLVWDEAMWSSNDQRVGLAGTTFKDWDYSKDDFLEATIKDAWVGLTVRHRIMTSSTAYHQQRLVVDLVPVSGLIDFVTPHFADVVREEWDRSRITADSSSMEHFRKLMAHSVVVHDSNSSVRDMRELALSALNGKLPAPDRFGDPQVPEVLSDDSFVSSGKVSHSRRSALVWLGIPQRSWLRYELGTAKLQYILDYVKISDHHGHFCEEITTASSTTSSGATGQVAGTMAYRLAIRCGRHFGSEQGLRQHISALHAPLGTWLCRTCGSDCITSQARTHHERSCGQPLGGTSGDQGGSVGATPTVGQGASGKGGVGKKKSRASSTQQDGAVTEEKDPDGSFRVPGYRGVWINKAGKHFVKVEGERLTESEDSDQILYFDNIDDAAHKYDDVLGQTKKKNQKLELNFKNDGTRIQYEDNTPASNSGVAGSASNVVPALSVINIKDLPPDVKPLLRDPRQTSRTGGNSKRHVYAYRGVCRQARKGHDRWQSQISFMGVNHYLGTFDSEWDAAAIYAWAHLILYGEEATRQAQKEGEEAAAAFEQEKKDIAEGKIPEPPAKPEKKKKNDKKDKSDSADAGKEKTGSADVDKTSNADKPKEGTKKRKAKPKEKSSAEKKPRTVPKGGKAEKEAIAPTLSKGVSKAPILGQRQGYEGLNDSDLEQLASEKLVAARDHGYFVSELLMISPSSEALRPCVPLSYFGATSPVGCALLLGLAPNLIQWDLQEFLESNLHGSEQDLMTAMQMLAVEYDEEGINEKFRSVVQGKICIVGSASKSTQRHYDSLGLGSVPLGGAVGSLDCHIGGLPGSCSENAACIRYHPSQESDFQFACGSKDDVVTLNGQRLTPEMGYRSLNHEDICTVGARVFAFILPVDK